MVVDRYLSAGTDQADKNLVDKLTHWEREVLLLMADGLSNTEIAGRLFVSVGTVKDHVSAILAKLDVGSRVQAALLAQRTGPAERRTDGRVTTTAVVAGRWPTVPPWMADLLLVALALAEAVLNITDTDTSTNTNTNTNTNTTLAYAVALIAAGALLLRRRFPYLTFLLTVPGLMLTDAGIAALVALYSLARYTSNCPSRCPGCW